MPQKLVTVKTCSNPVEAAFLKAYLEDNGIPASDGAEDARAWTGRYAAIGRGVRLRVAPKDAGRARDLLENPPLPEPGWEAAIAYGAEKPSAPRANEPITRCPNCGSANVAEAALPAPVRVLITVLFLGLPLLFRKVTYICRDCDWGSNR